MANIIQTKHGSTIPTVNDLSSFELGYNTEDHCLYIKDYDENVQKIKKLTEMNTKGVDHLKNVQAFVTQMNSKSADIGMNNTIWMTPSGLYTPSASVPYSIAHNSHTTANDLMRLLILCKHTPRAYGAMSKVTYDFNLSGKTKHTTNILLDGVRYKKWASTYGYTMLAGKGGSLSETYGEIGAYGILNVAMILKDSTENVYAWVIVGLQNTEEDKDTLLVLAHDLIEMCKGSPATQAILNAAGREPYPVGMACCQLTKNGTYAEDIAELVNAIVYNGDEIRVSASTAKMMTMCVAAGFIEQNRIQPEYGIVLTLDDIVGGSGLGGLSVGDLISVEDAMAVCMMLSDNALATAIGYNFGRVINKSMVFIAHRGQTKYSEIVSEINMGKEVVVEATISGSLYRLYFSRKMSQSSSSPNILYFFSLAGKDLYYTYVAPNNEWGDISAVVLQKETIVDAGDYFSANKIEDVLQEIGHNITSLSQQVQTAYDNADEAIEKLVNVGLFEQGIQSTTAFFGNITNVEFYQSGMSTYQFLTAMPNDRFYIVWHQTADSFNDAPTLNGTYAFFTTGLANSKFGVCFGYGGGLWKYNCTSTAAGVWTQIYAGTDGEKITPTTNLNTLGTGKYPVNGVQNSGLPENVLMYGLLVQTEGTYKCQIFYGGKSGDVNVYIRRWQTGSASYTAWKTLG